MLVSAILVAILAIISQWWFFAPATRCMTYPLTTGLLVGIAMGNPMLGMLAGANIQLVYLGWINTGGVMPSNTMVAGIYGTALTILSGANPKLAVTFAIPFSLLGLLMVQIYQTINSFWVHKADKALENGKIEQIRFLNYVPSFIISAIVYGIPAFLLVLLGKNWATGMVKIIPQNLTIALEVVGGIMPALGIAMLLNYLGKRSLVPYFFIGFFLTAYLKLEIMAVAIFSALIAYLIFEATKQKKVEKVQKKTVRRLTLNNRTGANIQSESNSLGDNGTTEISAADYKVKLTKSDLIKTWLWEQSDEATYNYERLQALGLTNMMIHSIKKLYPNDRQKQAQELKKYMVFFNTEPHMIGPVIHGIALSMEEARANGAAVTADDINGVRTGLMGPAAGIGDTVQQGIIFPILASIGCSMALEHNFLGPIFFTVIFEILIYSIGYWMFMYGYKKGKKSVLSILKSGILDKVTNAFSIVGLMVVGTMAATRVTIQSPLIWRVGQSTIKLQSILNKLAPGILPLAITCLVWYLLKKKVNATWIIVGIFIVGILFSYLGIFGIK
ncbi:PTS system mannose/fructose/sorbose family transporter subunit IID [Lactobacillus mulieris]|uniref:PTS system mannose/fructose/sorbose family transporter subunit IID n=1 Tax=Lactobacillus mulieris TaxID=2508708 RepID=A0AAP3GXU8_9LACO|nr:PTS system mannose/fructose/sorbose family transporter subunit IID [Lactobacillus mulieris]MCZ3845459.1 PTS system mannose/fructose/sorbose family transporter subunit IID [Lactobacillus mulieris]MCZ3877066.1 PTS system mannose/fructose/sorbose family transporter subunit IID [Lactobacillus mulieris]MCZ3900543.1 PTS system mannose/fructose/sorbose family transporter subunit IID [Lactobacillus mulieris]MCZ9650030.1 PTS system mannose/fructose/sorbose family transporter subunit IID [Lactobacillu